MRSGATSITTSPNTKADTPMTLATALTGRLQARLIGFILVCSFGLGGTLLSASTASAAVGPCTDVQLIGLRGSGENPPDPAQHGMGSLVGPVADEIALQIQDAGSVSFYGLPYAAGDASPTTVLSGSYFDSKKAGSALLHNYLAEVTSACPSMKLVVLGYSQGAHAAGDQLAVEPTSVTNHVAALVMFGDPRFNPEASYTWGTFDSRNYGINGKRSLNDFSSWSNRVFSFCNQNDLICQGIGKDHGTGPHAQTLYVGNYSTLVAGLVRRRLGYPRPASARTPLDLAFVIDTTGSMGSSIEGVKSAAANIAQTLEDRGSDFRIGLVDFKDHPDQGDPYASQLDLQMTSNATAFSTALDGLFASGGGDGPEAVYSGLMTAINDLNWRNVTRKAIILMGDAPAKDPEPITGFTSASVTDAARALDPATINPLLVGGASPAWFQSLADNSGGTIFQADDPEQVAEQVVAAVDQAAIPLYTSLTVGTPARPGTTVVFSAAGSYYDAGEIVSYAWDFDGDGVADQTTTANHTTHVYDAPFAGIASVTVSTDDEHDATVTAAVDIRDDAPLPPGPPTALSAASNEPGSISASWAPPADGGGGTLIGYSVDIENVTSGEIVYSAVTDTSSSTLAVTEVPAGTYQVRIRAASDGGVGDAAQRTVDVLAIDVPGSPPNIGPPPPAPLLPAPATPTAVASFSSSSKSLRVSKTGRFRFAFQTVPPRSGKISLKSTRKIKIGSTKRVIRLLAKSFTASSTGNVKVKFKLSSRKLKALKRVKKLRFVVTVTLAGKRFTTTLTLKAPKKA